MKESRGFFPSLVCVIHRGAAEHMQEGGGCVDGAKVPVFLEQAGHYVLNFSWVTDVIIKLCLKPL